MQKRKSKVPAKKPAAQIIRLSDKEKVQEKFPKAICRKSESGYSIIAEPGKVRKKDVSICQGFSKTDSAAWKKAAHAII